MIYKTVLKGRYYTAIDQNQVDYQLDSLVCIDNGGTIARVVLADEDDYTTIIHTAE